MAWIGKSYPLPSEPATTDESRKAEDLCGPGGRPTDLTDHSKWAAHVGAAIDWTWDNIMEGKLRIRMSHVGGHFADYLRSEMIKRYMVLFKKWTVVFNGVYQFVYKKYGSHIAPYSVHKASIDNLIQNEEKIGNIMEIAFARMWCRGDDQAIWRLMELLEWEFVYYETQQEAKADHALNIARAWRPLGGSRKVEASPAGGNRNAEASSSAVNPKDPDRGRSGYTPQLITS